MKPRLTTRTRASLLLCAMLTFACPRLALAQANDPGALIEAGVAARRAGDDAGALALFTQAWEQSQAARARAQMALAEQALGRFVLAEAHLVEALAATADPWIVERRATLEEALATVRGRLAQLEVRVELVPATSEDTSEDHAAAGNGMAPAVPVERTGSALPTVGWIGAGVGVIGVGFGVAFYAQREAAATDYNSPACLLPTGATREETCGGLRDDVGSSETLMTVSLVAGGTLLVAGLALVLFGGGSAGDDVSAAHASARCVPVLGTVVGAACEGRF